MSSRRASVNRKRKEVGSGPAANVRSALVSRMRKEDKVVPVGHRIALDIWMQVLPFTNYKTVQTMRQVSILYNGIMRDRTPRRVVYSFKMSSENQFSEAISTSWPFVRDVSSSVTRFEHNAREYFEKHGIKSWANARSMPVTVPPKMIGKSLNRSGGRVSIGLNLESSLRREFYAQFHTQVSTSSWPIFQYFSNLMRSPHVYFKHLHLLCLNIKVLESAKMDWMTSKIQCNRLSLQYNTPYEHVKMQAWLSENIVANKVSITFDSHEFGSATAKALADGFLRMGKWARRKVDVNVLSLDTLKLMIEEFQGLPTDDIRHLPPLLKIAKGRFAADNFRAKFSENCVDESESEVSEADQSEAEESETEESETEELDAEGSEAEESDAEESEAEESEAEDFDAESENYRFCNLGAKQDILVSIVPAYFHGYYYSEVSFERIDCIH